jgi:hypothetical protein
MIRGQNDEAVGILRDQVLPSLRKLGEPALLAQVLFRLGLLARRSGQQEEALALLIEARSNASRVGDRQVLQAIGKLLGTEEPE